MNISKEIVGFIIYAFIFMLPAILHHSQWKKLTQKVTAKCVDIELRYKSRVRSSCYIIYFEYKINNTIYKKRSKDDFARKPNFNVNEDYIIYVNPNNPTDFSCRSPKMPLWEIGLAIVGIVFIIIMFGDLFGVI